MLPYPTRLGVVSLTVGAAGCPLARSYANYVEETLCSGSTFLLCIPLASARQMQDRQETSGLHAEVALALDLLRGGYRLQFQRNTPCGGYRVDFYDQEARICVDVDTVYRHSPCTMKHRQGFVSDLPDQTTNVPKAAGAVERSLRHVIACGTAQAPRSSRDIARKHPVLAMAALQIGGKLTTRLPSCFWDTL